MLKEFRDYFFSELEKKNQSPKNKAQILMDDLHLSRSIAYKKITGAVPISLEEVLILAKKYDISIDAALSGQGDRVMLRYPSLDIEEMSPWKFMDQLLEMLTMLQQLIDMTGMLSRAASDGSKQLSDGQASARFDLHHNDVVFTNIKFLATSTTGRTLFTTFDSPNFIICADLRVMDHIETWFDHLKSKSIKISKEGEKHRQMFFNEIQRRISDAELVS